MTSNENKCDAVLHVINEALTEHKGKVNKAMQILECMNTKQEEYKNACSTLMISSFVVSYLSRIKAVAETRDIKSTENLIRFHSYYQTNKGAIVINFDDTSSAQYIVLTILNGIIERFFDI